MKANEGTGLEIVADMLIVAVCLFALGSLAALGWLFGRLEALRSQGVSSAYLPNYSVRQRGVLVGWCWSNVYQDIGDAEVRRAVLTSRALMVAFAIAAAALVEVGRLHH